MNGERVKAMSQKNYKSTFILHLQFRQNNNWQGTIKWIEGKKTLRYRSALELINIIDSTCPQDKEVENGGLDGMKKKNEIV